MNSSERSDISSWLCIALLGCGIGLCAVSANAQGVVGAVQFDNGSRITNALTLQPADIGTVVGLYYSLDTNGSASAFTLGAIDSLHAPGIFGGVAELTNTTPGIYIRAQVRAWSQGYGTFEDAVASGDSNVLVGRSNPFVIFLGYSGGPPLEHTGQYIILPFLVAPVPEPSGLILSILFAGLFGIVRRLRRK